MWRYEFIVCIRRCFLISLPFVVHYGNQLQEAPAWSFIDKKDKAFLASKQKIHARHYESCDSRAAAYERFV
jgi:hypothetical protein